MGAVHSCGLNRAIVISGGCLAQDYRQEQETLSGCLTSSLFRQVVVGDWGWAWWFFSDVQSLELGLMSLEPECREVMTLQVGNMFRAGQYAEEQGVPVTVTAVARVKVMREPQFLTMALEQFLARSQPEIRATVLQTLEGHLRAILATLTVEEVYR